MEKSHLDKGGDFADVSANVHPSLPTRLEQNKPLTVTFAEDHSKASLYHALWGACFEFTRMSKKVSSSRDANVYWGPSRGVACRVYSVERKPWGVCMMSTSCESWPSSYFIPGTHIDKCIVNLTCSFIIIATHLRATVHLDLCVRFLFLLVHYSSMEFGYFCGNHFLCWTGSPCRHLCCHHYASRQWERALGYSRLKGMYLGISGACAYTCPRDAQPLLMRLNPEQHHVLPFQSWASLCIHWCSSAWSCSTDSKGRTKAGNQKKIKFSLLSLPM